jgi:hypothetical protein
VRCREALHELEFQDARMSHVLILIDDLFSACWEKKEKRKKKDREKEREVAGLFPGLEARHTFWLCQVGFSHLLHAVKG